MLILKTLTWFHMLQLQLTEFGVAALVGCSFTITTIATLCATLGSLGSRRSVSVGLMRCAIVLLLPLFIGVGLWLGFEVRARQMGMWGGFGQDITALLIRTGRAWPMWTALASLFLSALLLCFRADGQRLIRVTVGS